MKKLLLGLLLGLSLVSCDTVSLNNYKVKYIPEQNIINYNGNWVQNMDINGNVLNDISIRPYINDNSIILFSKEDIFMIKIDNVRYRLRFINNNAYEIIFLENNYLQNNYNQEINIELVTYE